MILSLLVKSISNSIRHKTELARIKKYILYIEYEQIDDDSSTWMTSYMHKDRIIIVFITKAKAIAPLNPANHITTCMFNGITCFRPKLAKYDRGKMLHTRPIRQNNITNKKNGIFIRAYRPVNNPIPIRIYTPIAIAVLHDNTMVIL